MKPDILARLEALENTLNNLPPGMIPGGIIPFSGSFGGSDGKRPIPRGGTEADETWILCDGANGTPDLRHRFIVGAGPAYAPGATGGAASAASGVSGSIGATTLDANTLPSHAHGTNASNLTPDPFSSDVSSDGNGPVLNSGSVYAAGASWGHTHALYMNNVSVSTIPPYYALAYIMKL